jgi:hypothetical protein
MGKFWGRDFDFKRHPTIRFQSAASQNFSFMFNHFLFICLVTTKQLEVAQQMYQFLVKQSL